jgi:hypothetical protein
MSIDKSIIYIENGEFSQVKNAIENWIELYFDDLNKKLIFKIYKVSYNYTVIELNMDIKNELFNYLVNYLKYPENIDYKVDVNGFTRIKDKKLFSKNLINERIQIFVPIDDNEYDIVFGVTESGVIYKIGFNGNIEIVNSKISFNEPKVEYKNTYSENIKIDKETVIKKLNEKKVKKFNQRFLFISILFLIITFLSGYIAFNTEYFNNAILISSFGLLFWIMIEQDLLKDEIVFIKFLGLSIILTLLGYYVNIKYGGDVFLRATKIGFIYLILFKLLRYLYISIYNREPDFDKYAERMIDRFFAFLIIAGSIFMSIFF